MLSVKKRTVCFFGSQSSIAIHFSSHLFWLERCLMVPVTSLFTPYCLAAYTHDVIRLWLLDLFDHLYSFGLVCGWRCSFRHSRFYPPVRPMLRPKLFTAMANGLAWRMVCEEISHFFHYLANFFFCPPHQAQDCGQSRAVALNCARTWVSQWLLTRSLPLP